MVSLATGSEKDIPGNVRFPHKIGRRLTLTLGFLITVVLLVGGLSLYLARSISQSTKKIKGIGEEIEHIDRAHFVMHHLIEQAYKAIITGVISEVEKIPGLITQLESEITEYKRMEAEGYFGGKHDSEQHTLKAITYEVTLLTRLIQKVAASISRGIQASQEDLAALSMSDHKLRDQFQELNRLHNKKISRELLGSRAKMNIIIGLYLAFLVGGGLGLVGWSWAVSKNIVSPIRNLASAAHEVAGGNFDKRVPVTSKDEIGQLSYSFNFMAERIRDHEEKLKGFAALEERERIAQELHDSLAQNLALIHLKIVEAEQQTDTNGPSSVRTTLKVMREVAGEAFDDVRQAIFGLRTMVSKNLGFIPTLTEYLHDFSEQRGFAVDLKVDGNGVPEFSSQQEIQLIRIIHEALTNVFKHAEATASEVRFEQEGKVSKVIIEDNGKGFLLEEVMEK
ncbi:MAG: HAMP domain-containing protein, partial [Thermodesulfobacteriota bacterium]